jgi:hypothetical protein
MRPSQALRDASLSAPPKSTWDDIAGDAGGAKVSDYTVHTYSMHDLHLTAAELPYRTSVSTIV